MHGEICIFGEFADIIMFMKVLRIMPVNTVPTPKTIFAAYVFTSGVCISFNICPDPNLSLHHSRRPNAVVQIN